MDVIKNDPFNAFLDTPGPAVASGSGTLSGKTLAVKDIYDVAGYKTGRGNPQWLAETQPAAHTAAAVQILLDAGARFIGKTQTEEFAFSLTGHNAHYPRPINPAAPDRMTGGSSSGSIAAVAAGLADIATGSDTGGSVRAPASYCGLVGLRTSHGAITLDGTMPLAPSFDVFGWFARDVDLYCAVGDLYLDDSGARLTNLMRLPEQDALVAGEAEKQAYQNAVSLVEAVVGQARTEKLVSADVEQRYWCMRRIQAHEAWRGHGAWLSAADRQLGPGVKERFAFGQTISTETLLSEAKLRDALRTEVTDILGNDGLFVSPTVPGAAPLAASSFADVQDYRERALRLLCLSGLTGLPELTLPLGTVDGAPFGLSLTGPKGSDRALLAIGQQILDAKQSGAQ
ncbi:MAG: amidase [Alphaproteobacteria bacterium]|nr:amidase [Alphaproteobacteria bacterium]